MRMRFRHRLSAASLVAALAVSLASAGITKHQWEFGFQSGNGVGDNNEFVDEDRLLTQDFEFDSNSFRVGYALTTKFMIELFLENYSTEQRVTPERPLDFCSDPSDPTSCAGGGDLTEDDPSVLVDTDFFFYATSLTYSMRTEREGARVIPYLSFGFGVAVQERDEYAKCVRLVQSAPLNDPGRPNPVSCEELDEDLAPLDPNVVVNQENFRIHQDEERTDSGTVLPTIGGGARFFVTRWMALRAELRYSHYDTFGANHDGFEFTVGASFVVGRQ